MLTSGPQPDVSEATTDRCFSSLGSVQLSGTLSLAVRSAAALACSLQALHLQSNRLSGTMPNGLTGLASLQLLNLAYNALTGR